MIDSMLHPLDEIKLVGHTWHGLAEGGAYSPTVRMAQGAPAFALPFSAPPDTFRVGSTTHLQKKPGIGPVPLSPEVLSAERAQGRAWQNYGLLSGIDLIWNGHVLNGWPYVDAAGDRWLIRPYGPNSIRTGTVVAGSPATLQFRVTRFGIVGEPVDTPVEIETILADIGQDSLPDWEPPSGSALGLFINSISSSGDRVVVAIYSTAEDLNWWYPLGYWLLTVTGDGPHFTVVAEVLKRRTEVFPAFTSSGSAVTEYAFAYDELETTETYPPGSGTTRRKYTIVGSKWTPATLSNHLPLGSGVHSCQYTGRIVNMVFDADDVLRTITADVTSSCDYSFPDYTIVSTGARYSTGPSDRDTTTSRTCSSTSTLELVLRVDGLERNRTTYTRTQSSTWGSHSYYLPDGVSTRGTSHAERSTGHHLQAEGDVDQVGGVSASATATEGQPQIGESGWTPRGASFIQMSEQIQVQAHWGIDTAAGGSWPWDELTLRAYRHGNHLVASATELSIESPSSTRRYTPAVVSPRSVWLGNGVPNLYARSATYEPYRDEIATGVGDELRSPCWI